jgi:hypothetical protein
MRAGARVWRDIGVFHQPARRLRSALLALAIAAAPLPALAQAGDKAQAEILFRDGRALMKKGTYEEACPKFAESMRLDPSSGTQINLGQCYEAQGKTASAWAEYNAAAALARNQNRSEYEAKATQLASRLEPKLSKLRIDAPAIPDLAVKRDGIDLARSLLGSSVPIDPGEHTIVATAPGYKEWSNKIVVGKDGDAKTMTIPPLEKLPEAAAAAPPPTPPDQASQAPPPPAPAASSPPPRSSTSSAGGGSSGLRTAGFVIGGLGVVGIGVGAVFGLLAAGIASDAKSRTDWCGNDARVCTSDGWDEVDKAKTQALISTLGFGLGAAALATGVILVVVGKPAARTEAARARLVPAAGPRGGGASFVAAF